MIQLKDICDIYDCPHTTAKDEGKGYPLVRTPNVGKGRLLLNGIHRVSEDVYNSRNSRAIPEEGDLILAREAPVGNVSIIMQGQRVCLGQRVVLIKPKRELVDPHYLTYYLLSAEVQNRLKNHANGAVVAHLNVSDIRNPLVSLPELDEQIAIGKILRSIEDKIELNNRINHNLEEQAQALYKSWFVDFEPFRGGNFVDSELGMIPEGWSVQKAEELCEINIGKTPPRKEHHWFSNNNSDVTWISISDMGSSEVYISKSSEMLTKEACKKFNVIIVPEGTVLLSFKLTVGRVSIAAKELTTNEAIARFLVPTDAMRSYLYLALKSYDYSKLGSTSSIATAVNSKIIKKMALICPPEDIIEKFGVHVSGIFRSIKILQEEISCLCEQRDSLLPHLMSGEITC